MAAAGERRGGVLAIDLGEKKSGFAYADPLRVVLRPLDTVRRAAASEQLLDHVAALAQERDVAVLLVGLPLLAQGEEGERARATRRFAQRLAERFPELEVCLYDERLTTKEAEARLRESGERGASASAKKDGWSALVLLEDWVRSGEPRS